MVTIENAVEFFWRLSIISIIPPVRYVSASSHDTSLSLSHMCKKAYMLFRHARKIQIQRCMRIESTRHCASSFVDDVMIISYLTDYYGLLETSREAYCTRYS